MRSMFGAHERRVEDREYLGQPALVVVAARTYDTTVEDLWEALTTPERMERWFLPIVGELKVGGRYQLQGNAGGTITRCDPPSAFDVTWEFAGATSWVSVRLTPEGKRARLTLEHIAHKDGVGAEHLKQFGPGAVGIGWDLSFEGLAKHVAHPDVPLDPAEAEAWCLSPEGKTAIRGSGEAWAAAQIAMGHDQAEAKAQAERTIAFYTGG